MNEDIYCSIELNYRGIKIIYEGLRQAVEKWPGGDPEEQQHLIAMREIIFINFF